MADFNPYHKWLGIPLKDQPPNHYRLLGIELFESDPDVIESAADQRMAHVRTFQTGQNSAVSQRILNELSAAKLCLLNPQKRAEYDRPLREKTQAADSAISPGGSRGEGGQPRPSIEPHPGPRPVPQAVPLQRARPMPQVEAMPLVQPTPVIVPGAGPSSGINIHKRVSRKAPLWQQPAVLVAAAAAVVMMAIGGYYVTPAKQTPATSVVTNPSKESRPSAPTATSPVASVDPAAPVDSLPPPPAKSSTGTTVAAPSVALPSAPSTPDFEIIEATWGVGDKWVNVTDAVRNRVKDHRLMMMVWANLFGSPEDPAPGTGKKLRIQYRARGRRYTVEYPDVFFAYLDGNPLAPPTDSPDGLELLEARYGAGASYVDVLAQLRDHLHDGRLSVPANQFVGTTADELAKHGLNSGTFKLLWVRYRNGTGEHYTYAWKADRLAIDSRLPEAAGPPVDLLKLIDVNRDVVEGNWTLADGILSGPATQNARIEIPFDPHEEYALTVVAEGDPEIKDISVLLPVDGRQVMSVLDGFSGIGSGLHMINGRVANDNPAYPWRRTRMLEQGRPNTLLYVVRRRSIRVFRDGAEIIRWSGDPQTFSIADIWALRSTRRIGLEAYDTPFRVRKLVLVPLTPEKSPMLTQLEPGKTVDLLKQIDRDRDLLYGNWQYDGQSLVSADSDKGQMQLPAVVPGDYELNVVARRESGNESLSFTLPVAGAQVSLLIDAQGGKLSGLRQIDGKNIDSNETKHEGAVFADGQAKSITVTVRKNHVRAVCDGQPLVGWTGDVNRLKPTEHAPYNDRIYVGSFNSRYRLTKIELTPLSSEAETASPALLAGEPVDLLKQIDVKRDAVAGDWQVADGVLISPDTPFSRLLLPPPPAPDYELTIVGERVRGGWGLGVALVADGRQTVAEIDGFNGHFTGFSALDGKGCNENETSRQGRLMVDGKPVRLVYTVRPNSIRVALDGRTIIDWKGDPRRLSMIDGYKLPDPTRLALCEFKTVCRISKIEVVPLTAEPSSVSPAMVADGGADVLKQIDFTRDAFRGKWQLGTDGAILTPDDAYPVLVLPSPPATQYRLSMRAERLRGTGAFGVRLVVGGSLVVAFIDAFDGTISGLGEVDGRHCNNNVTTRPGHFLDEGRACNLVYTIRERSVTVELDGKPLITWTGDPASLSVHDIAKLPDPSRLVLLPNSSVFRLTNIELVPLPSKGASSRPPNLADLTAGNKSRRPVPDDEALKKAKEEMRKKFASRLSAAKSPDQKRGLAQELAQKAVVDDETGARAYVLLSQAIDLAKTAGDLDLAWQTIDQLAKTFAIDGLALRQQSLVDVGKGAKSPEQNWVLADAACRLMVSALAARDAATVKKAATQAQSFAKRTKDKTVQKAITSRVNDAAKLAGEIEAVAAARETLKTSPDDPQANQTVGHYELCAAGDWQAALPKLAKSGDANWKKLAADELALGARSSPGSRPGFGNRFPVTIQPADATRQLAAADAWWSRAEDEPWPGKHYLRLRAAHWYSAAYRSLVDVNRVRAGERLKALLAIDEGSQNWELFKRQGFQTEQPTGDVVRIDNQSGGLETVVEYDGPIDVTLVARTTGNMVRLSSHRWTWSWNYAIEPNRWHTLRFVITPLARTVFADGVSAYTDASTSRTPRTLNSAPVSIYGGDEVIEIKKFIVRSLE